MRSWAGTTYRGRSFPTLIAQHGHSQAEQAGAHCEGRRLTWAEFDAATNQVAHGLLRLGLGARRAPRGA